MFKRKPSNQIAYHVSEIIRIMRETAPDQAHFRGFQFTVDEGDQPQNMKGSAVADNDLYHIRPGRHSGWKKHSHIETW